MKILVIHTGKTRDRCILEGATEYFKRCGYYTAIKVVETEDFKGPNDPVLQRKKEAQLQLKQIEPDDNLILLDENGLIQSSRAFADWIQSQSITSTRRLVFLSGGPYGFDPSIMARAQQMISLSPMTFPHQLVRLIFSEQLYRAFTIINKLPYHHD